jgi:hypothetical protein
MWAGDASGRRGDRAQPIAEHQDGFGGQLGTGASSCSSGYLYKVISSGTTQNINLNGSVFLFRLCFEHNMNCGPAC